MTNRKPMPKVMQCTPASGTPTPTLQPHGLQLTRLLCLSLSPRVCSNSCPLSQWYHPTISSSVTLFSFCLPSFPASGSFPMSRLFASGGQSIGASTSASIHPMNIQDLFPLGWTGLISLQSKGLSRVFSSTKSNNMVNSTLLLFNCWEIVVSHSSQHTAFWLKNYSQDGKSVPKHVNCYG